MAKSNPKVNEANDTKAIEDIAKLTIEQIKADEKICQQTVDQLLKRLSDDSTAKADKRPIRRFLRQLGHKGGLRNSTYRKTKTVADFLTAPAATK